jgi:hypothetical protein
MSTAARKTAEARSISGVMPDGMLAREVTGLVRAINGASAEVLEPVEEND